MEFKALGPLEVSDSGRALSLGPRKQRALLARLLLDVNRTVAVERLVDDLWGEDVPDSAVKMVQIYVSGLRKVLPDEVLITSPPGYALKVDPCAVDVGRLELLRADAAEAIAAGDPARAAPALREALGLWRGRALAEFTEPFAVQEGMRLEELRVACLEDAIDAELALGRHGDVVAELESLIAREPLRERLRGQLMLARYRNGRQADALAAYQDFRRALADQLGIEPSPRLRDLERAILMQDPALELAPSAARAPAAEPAAAARAAAPPGRAAELARLERALARVLEGERRGVFVTGEPGAGKTTLVGAFLAGAEAEGYLVARGQCVEHGGPSEPYLPLLDALGRAADGPHGRELAGVLAERAQSWLVQLPWLVEPDELADIQAHATGITRERMLRDGVEALERLATRRPVVLVLEDLGWSDGPTLDLLATLLRRPGRARILVVATTTPASVGLVHELCLRGVAEEIALPCLNPDAVAELLRARLGAELPEGLAEAVHERTEGNPLFVSHLADHWAAEGSVDAEAIPATLRASIEHQVRALDRADQALLEAAALVGREFAPATVAAAVRRGDDEVADRLAELARTKVFVERREDRFAFNHDLHRAVIAGLVAPSDAVELHWRIGAQLLDANEERPGDIAFELAGHFVAGRDAALAVRFLKLAADRAFARLAYPEGVELVREALRIAEDLDEGPTRDRNLVELLSMLGQAMVAVEGWSSPEAEACLARARELAWRLDDNEPLVTVVLALATVLEVRGDYAKATATVDEIRQLIAGDDVSRQLQCDELLACSLFHQGSFARALEHAESGVERFAPEERGAGGYDTLPATLGDNAGVSCLDWSALASWYLGRPDEALARALRAKALAEEPERAHSRPTALAQLAVVHQCRREPGPALEAATATVEAGREHGYAYRVAMGRILRGWAIAMLGEPGRGVEELVGGLHASRSSGAHMDDPYYLGLLAEALLVMGDVDSGLAAAEEGLAVAAHERSQYFAAELLRLRALLLLERDADDEAAVGDLEAAIAMARRQWATPLELRAAVALARVRIRQGRAGQARGLIAPVLERFAEGTDSPDVRDATALLGGVETPAPG